MGAAGSHFAGSNHEQLLDRFGGPESIAISDTFWRDLLTFPQQLTRFDPALLQQELAPTCHSLVSNDHATLHFQKLLVHVLRLLVAARKHEARAPEATNALVVTRAILLYATQHMGANDLAALVHSPPGFLVEASHDGGEALTGEAPLLYQFISVLLDVVSSTDVSASRYLLQLEACNVLITLASTQLYTPHTAAYPGAHPFTEVIMQHAEQAPAVVQSLLHHYCTRPPLPARAPLFVPAPASAGSGSKVVRFVRSAAASVLWLPYQAFTLLLRSSAAGSSPLADTGQLLLLLLTCHSPASGQLPSNGFRAALHSLQDADDRGDAEAGAGVAGPGEALLSFSALYNTLGRQLSSERSVLLLYLLLHGCRPFQEYVLVRSDVDTLLVPLLKQLHGSDSRTASQTYMLLIIVLILSQDAALAANVHQIAVASAPWYRERHVANTTLGSLLAVVLLRTAHANLAKLQDVYLQTNTLAALTNLAPHMAGLSSHAAQRLVALFDMVGRRYRRLLRSEAAAPPPTTPNGGTGEAAAAESQMYAEFLRIVLEIINCALAAGKGPASNPQLVYSLLHRQEVFASFRHEAQFQELLGNVFLVLDFFNARVEEAKSDPSFEWSVESVLHVINATVGQIRWSDQLRHFPDLRFEYAEADASEDFFVPYVWSLAVADTWLPWQHSAVVLFTPAAASSDRSPSTSDIFGSQDFKGAAQETEPLTSDAHDGAAQPALSQEV